jgi:hypothetical protein
MNNILLITFDWIRNDYKTNPLRFFVEVLAWAVSIGCSITMAARMMAASVKIPDVASPDTGVTTSSQETPTVSPPSVA